MFGTGEGHGQDQATLLGRGKRRRRGAATDRQGAPILSVQGLTTEAEFGECPLREVGFDLRPGEVLGIAGVDGNGQKHLAEVLAGQRGVTAGRIAIAGQDVTADGVIERRRHGVRYITDERVGEGTVGAFSVATNLVLKEIGAPPLWQRGISLWDRIHAHARERIARYDVRTPSERTPIGKLSGGNIQKVLLARELNTEASVVIFNKPTYGLDVRTAEFVRAKITELAAEGAAALLISTEIDELIALCDRIAVMSRGAITGVVDADAGAEERVGELMVAR
jgi:general nucleoside transport system ATP-binding protein